MRHGFQRLPLTAVALLAAMGLAAPSFAQQTGGGAGTPPAPATTGTGAAAGNAMAGHGAMAGRARTPESWAERQLSRLHRQLNITSAQEADWTKFKEVTLADAHNIGQLYHDRAANFEKMNAVDNLKDYQKIMQTQADNLGNKVTAFETLYNSLSPEQKETADRIFRYKAQRAEQRHMAMHHRPTPGGATENGGTSKQ